MALYVSAGRRRRRIAVVSVAALIVGLVIGALAGRTSAPTLEDRVAQIQGDAEVTVAGLRVISLHAQDDTVGSQTGGGTDLVLDRTATELRQETRDAPWVDPGTLADLLDDLETLRAMPNRSDEAFSTATEDLATRIESAFGLAPAS